MKFLLSLLKAASLAGLCALTTPAAAQEVTGVVLLHGKAGEAAHVQGVAEDLEAAGYLVVTPDMPWSKDRAYDRSLTEAHEEIDGLIEGLRDHGATRIVIGGHSMGANMAIGYAATHPGLAAVLALGPGQTVEAETFRNNLGQAVESARQLVTKGKGDEPTPFPDLHLGKIKAITAKPRVYLSYFDPDGFANMPATTPKLTAPLLWVVGTADKNMLDRGAAYAFDRAPANPLNRYVEVAADHMGTPEAARALAVEWLKHILATDRQR